MEHGKFDIASALWLQTKAAEVARAFFGNPYIIRSMEKVLPEAIPMDKVSQVLDIGCGTGEWARRLVTEYPHMQIIGIDTSHELIHEAVNLTLRARTNPITFYQFYPTQDLNFPPDRFDVIHVHSVASFIITAKW